MEGGTIEIGKPTGQNNAPSSALEIISPALEITSSVQVLTSPAHATKITHDNRCPPSSPSSWSSRNTTAMSMRGPPFRSGSLIDAELLKLVPTLTGEHNFFEWANSLKKVLDSIDASYHQVLAGFWPKPVFEQGEEATPAKTAEFKEWSAISGGLLLVINGTIHKSVQSHIWNTFDGRAAYLALQKAFITRAADSRFDKYTKWVTLLYTSNSPEEFANKWRQALDQLEECTAPAEMPRLFVIFQFLTAVGANPQSRWWAKEFRANTEDCFGVDLEEIISDFLAYETRRLSTLAAQASSFVIDHPVNSKIVFE